MTESIIPPSDEPEDEELAFKRDIAAKVRNYFAATPANGEQVERVNGTIVPDRIWLLDLGGGDIEWADSATPDGETPVDAVAYVRLATLSTPTEDARSRVKVLEEALRPFAAMADELEQVAAQHKGTVPNDIRRSVNYAACVRARTALGNKETDRHG